MRFRTLASVFAQFAKFSPNFMAEGRGDEEQAERREVNLGAESPLGLETRSDSIYKRLRRS